MPNATDHPQDSGDANGAPAPEPPEATPDPDVQPPTFDVITEGYDPDCIETPEGHRFPFSWKKAPTSRD